jgi:phospho-N-acetylmuramoyl-pentapeptide-transferase
MIAVMLAGAAAMLVSLLGTPLLIRWLQARELGEEIREELTHHSSKRGTPTMGGLMIVAGAFLGYFVAHVRAGAYFSRGGLLVMFLVLGAGIVGFLDDWLQISGRNKLGLSRAQKMAGLFVLAVPFAVLAVRYAAVNTHLAFTRFDQIGWDMGTVLWIVFCVFVILGTANGTNFADGIDGLAGGSAVFAYSAFVIIGFWQFRHVDVYQVPQALDLALVASALTGACIGFLWWNAAPARIYMGDSGALPLGAGMAALAMLMNLHLLLPIIGALYVVETLSVMIQIRVFKWTGRRVFRMAPIHHHFELKGWPETTVVIRFWIICGLLTALSLGIFYADFINLAGVSD